MTTAATSPATPLPAAASSILLLDPRLLKGSANPRRKPVPTARVTEIADSMRKFHVLEPLIVRLVGNGSAAGADASRFQVVAGDTRQKAAIEAGLKEVPCIVRELNDLDMLELQLIENVQRNDMHPVDEGEAFKRLIDGKKYTAETLAKTIGKSVRWVYNRLEFTKLVPDVRQAFIDEQITATHAELMARLTAAQQKDAFKDGLFHREFDFDHHGEDDKDKTKRNAVSVRALTDWIAGNVRLPIESEVVQRELPAVADAIAEVAKQGPASRILQVTRETYVYSKDVKKMLDGVLLGDQWRAADSTKQRCEHIEKAVIVYGADQGKVLLVCTNKTCAKHWPELVAQKAGRGSSATRGSSGETAIQKASRLKREAAWKKRQEAQEKAAIAARARFARLKPALQKATLAALSSLTTVSSAAFSAMLARERIKSCKPADLPKVMVQKVVGDVFRYAHGPYDMPQMTRWAKLLGVNVPAIEKAAQSKAVAKPAAKKKQKPAREFLRKDAPAGTRKALAKRVRKAGKKR